MKSAEIGRRIIPVEFLNEPVICNEQEDIFVETFLDSRKIYREFGLDFAEEYVDKDVHFLRYATELLGLALLEDTVSVGFLRETALTADMFPELSQNKSYTLY